jgi:hypothetical protein
MMNATVRVEALRNVTMVKVLVLRIK